jgi:hypothetical protein
MITEELRKYIDMVNEEWNNDQLHEMARIGSKYHGIENVVIWVGEAPKQHGLRVKVSNIPNKMRIEDSFVIQMPSLDYDPSQVADWITPKMMKKILEWIKINQDILQDYEIGELTDTDVFLNSLYKVNK